MLLLLCLFSGFAHFSISKSLDIEFINITEIVLYFYKLFYKFELIDSFDIKIYML